jgi:di-N-acetylchitobiase
LDGINLDIEGNPSQRDALTSFTQEVNAALKAVNPYSQLTFDTTAHPSASDPGYDFVGLANATDFLFPMNYDMCWGTTVGAPNCPIEGVERGLLDYFLLDIPPEKLVLGLPWYGYNFPCTTKDPIETICNLSQPFNVDWQIIYKDILPLLAQSTTGNIIF